jgi:ABC-type phosphate/phosphonate transport system substrate-binding protein
LNEALTRQANKRPFACLPMYDWPEIGGDWNRLWAGIRTRLADTGLNAEAELHRADDPWQLWNDTRMLLGQTCGWPFISRLRDRVDVFGRFDFGLETQTAGDYFSVFVARPGSGVGDIGAAIRDDRFRLAVNSLDSQSGFRAFGTLLNAPGTIAPNRIVLTGSHRQSIIEVACERADLAAIDANSWRLALRHEPAASNVEVVGRSPDMPGLPLITAKAFADRPRQLLAFCSNAIDSLPERTRERLDLRGVVAAQPDDYLQLCRPPYSNIG